MNDFHVISVPSFSEFIAQVKPARGQIITTCLVERYDPEHYGVGQQVHAIPAMRLTLNLQAFNLYEELIWLQKSTSVHWANGPAMPGDVARYKAMHRLRDIVEERLKAYGVELRSGYYVLPNHGTPINGDFDCAEWTKDERGHVHVRARSEQ
jgi:hypothetical protein